MWSGFSDGRFYAFLVMHGSAQNQKSTSSVTHKLYAPHLEPPFLMVSHTWWYCGYERKHGYKYKKICHNNTPPTSCNMGITTNTPIQKTWWITHTPMSSYFFIYTNNLFANHRFIYLESADNILRDVTAHIRSNIPATINHLEKSNYMLKIFVTLLF